MTSRQVKQTAFAALLALCGFNSAYADGEKAVVYSKAGRPVSTAVASQPLGQLYVNQWVQLRASGEVVGNVVTLAGESFSPVSQIRVALVSNGRIVSEGLTSSQGQVVLPRVQPGLYTLVARGSNMIGSFSLAVLDMESGRHLPADFSVPVAQINDRSIDSLLASRASPNRPFLVRATNVVTDPLGRSRVIKMRDYKVRLDAEGTLHGDLALPGIAPAQSNTGGMNVILFDGGREIARTVSDQDGHYKFPGLKAGSYSIVANGSAGFAAVAVCAVEQNAAGSLSGLSAGNGQRFVASMLQDETDSVGTEVTETQNVDEVEEFALEPVTNGGFVDNVAPPPTGFPVGGGPMGGATGGGPAGLAGRIGPAAAIGGAVIAAALIADEDDNNNAVAVATQAVPANQ